MSIGCVLDKGGNGIALHPHCAEIGGQAQFRVEPANELGGIRIGIEAERCVEPRVLLTNMASIEVEDRWQKHRIERPVMQPQGLIRAAGVAHGMNRAEALAERHSALGGGHHHVPASIPVAAVAHGTQQVRLADAPLDAVARHRFGRRVHLG